MTDTKSCFHDTSTTHLTLKESKITCRSIHISKINVLKLSLCTLIVWLILMVVIHRNQYVADTRVSAHSLVLCKLKKILQLLHGIPFILLHHRVASILALPSSTSVSPVTITVHLQNQPACIYSDVGLYICLDKIRQHDVAPMHTQHQQNCSNCDS